MASSGRAASIRRGFRTGSTSLGDRHKDYLRRPSRRKIEPRKYYRDWVFEKRIMDLEAESRQLAELLRLYEGRSLQLYSRLRVTEGGYARAAMASSYLDEGCYLGPPYF